jgi:hypothetical protein
MLTEQQRDFIIDTFGYMVDMAYDSMPPRRLRSGIPAGWLELVTHIAKTTAKVTRYSTTASVITEGGHVSAQQIHEVS